MYSLFEKHTNINTGVSTPPEYELLRRTYKHQLETIVNYYQSRVMSVSSNHFLCRLLNMLDVPFSYEIDRFTEAALARSPYVAKHFNFTSEINYGRLHNGIFYGAGNSEIILYNESYFNPFTAINNWKRIKAIKVLEHPISDTKFLLPNGIKHSNNEEGLVVIEINIALLLVQYRGFILEQYRNIQFGDDSLLGVANFVHMYVLPSMMESHMEIVIFNKLINLYYDKPIAEPKGKHAITFTNYDNKLDRVLLKIMSRIMDSGYLYNNLLSNIPGIVNQNMSDVLHMPNITRTRQVWWALILTRLKAIKFMIEIGGESSIDNNGTYINKLRNDFKRILDEDLIASMLPKELYLSVVADLKKLVTI